MKSLIVCILLLVLPMEMGWAKSKKKKKPLPPPQEYTDAIFPRISPETAGRLYQMLKVIDEVLTSHGILYWIDGGTLLGAVRHGGIIPWDDDGDLEIFEQDKKQVISLRGEFEKYGLALVDTNPLHLLVCSRYSTYPSVDIFFSKKDQASGYYILSPETANSKWPKNRWTEEELSRLTKIQFGPIQLFAVAEPMRYLYELYGDNVMEVAKYQSHVPGLQTSYVNKIYQMQTVKLLDRSSAPYAVTDNKILLN